MNLLIIEDNMELLDSLQSSFADQGLIVDKADDGASGLYKAKINNYDLIILDIGLPKKDGKQVCAELRSFGKKMPIIMLSVESGAEIKAELLLLGADDYVVKPFSFIELSARVKACMRRPTQIASDLCRIGNVTLNANARSAAVGQKSIHFTPKEFFLLEYLMKHQGRVLSRQEILEHVWGTDANLFTNTLETHVANVRRKLKDTGARAFINTISNGGYKID